MANTVIGIFDNSAEAQKAVAELTARGLSRSNIDISNNATGSTTEHAETDEAESGIGKFFRSLFSDDSDKYETVARRSKSVVTVHASSSEEANMAADILDDYGAVDVDERAASYGYTGSSAANTNPGNSSFLTGLDPVNPDYSSGTGVTGITGATTDLNVNDANSKISVIEENLEVGKREVTTGGVRVRSRIVERPVEESIRLREETVRIERNPVDRIATSADLSNFNGLEIEMTETAEVPVVSKEARVVEEISLDKEVNERTETISDTVRKTEVDIENLHSDKSSI